MSYIPDDTTSSGDLPFDRGPLTRRLDPVWSIRPRHRMCPCPNRLSSCPTNIYFSTDIYYQPQRWYLHQGCLEALDGRRRDAMRRRRRAELSGTERSAEADTGVWSFLVIFMPTTGNSTSHSVVGSLSRNECTAVLRSAMSVTCKATPPYRARTLTCPRCLDVWTSGRLDCVAAHILPTLCGNGTTCEKSLV